MEQHLFLKAELHNWSLIGPGSWETATWYVFNTGCYRLESSEIRTEKEIDEIQVQNGIVAKGGAAFVDEDRIIADQEDDIEEFIQGLAELEQKAKRIAAFRFGSDEGRAAHYVAAAAQRTAEKARLEL